jgi:hypothetical protein
MLLDVEPLTIEPLTDQEVGKILREFEFAERKEKCEACGETEGVELECSRTQYHFEGEPDSAEDPNRQIGLCRSCAQEHHEHWDAMWSEYNSSRL